MTEREMVIKCYTAFLPALTKLPLTHRYWFWFNGDWKEKEASIASDIKEVSISKENAILILNNLKKMLENIKGMTDKEFENAPAGDIPFVLFHDPRYLSIWTEGIRRNLILWQENNTDGIKIDLQILKSAYPLIISMDILYGGIKCERRYTDESKKEIELVYEEMK